MTDQRNLILAIVLSIAILVGFQMFSGPSRIQPAQPDGTQQSEQTAASKPATPDVTVPTTQARTETLKPREQVIAEGFAAKERVLVSTPELHGSINLRGGRIDDLTLVNYRETTDPKSPEIVLLSPSGADNAYYTESGWIADDGATTPLPGPDTLWSVTDTGDLTPAHPVTLSWNDGKGLVFERTIAVDDKYMFTLTQRVHNTSDATVSLVPYSLASRAGTPQTSGYYILHEGPLGMINGRLKEEKYTELQKNPTITDQTTGGWIGITDKYWLVSVIPDQHEATATRFIYTDRGGLARYQVDIAGTPRKLAPNETGESTSRMFAGAKQVRLLDAYADKLGINNFSFAIDFGWFYFLTKPFFYAIDFIASHVGNFGVAILIFTVLVKAVFFPLANRSYKAMSKMKKLQPEMAAIRERFADDKVRVNQEVMELYKREKVSPVSGCLPIFIQIPVFFSLYKVLFVTIEMRQAPFFGWIHDLSVADPTTVFNLFGLIPWDPPSFLQIGVWPLIMGVTMWAQQKLNPAPADPAQQRIFMLLPLIFTYMLHSFPAGLVIYWAWNNTLSVAQQWVIMRQAGVKIR